MTVVLEKKVPVQARSTACVEETGPGGGMYVARAELVLARPDHRRLNAAGLDPDPLRLLAAACAHVDSSDGEEAELAVDLVPVSGRQVARWRGRLMRRAQRRGPSAFGQRIAGGPPGGGGGSLWSAVVEGLNGGKPAGGGGGRRLPRQSDLADGVGKFIPRADTQVFAVQILIRVTARHLARAQARLHQVMAVLDAWRGENWLRPVGPRRTGWRPYSNVWWRRRGFDRRWRTGEFAPARRQWVTAQEIAALLKPATVHCEAPNVVRTGGVVPPAPSALPTWQGQRGMVPLGRVIGVDGRSRLACVPQKDVLFGASFGKSGFGKSELALLQALSLAYGGMGAWFLDPHGSAVNKALAYLTHPAVMDRVMLIDLSVADPQARIAAWNPLSMEGRTTWEVQKIVGAVVGGLAAAQGWGDGAPRARAILSNSVKVLAHLAARMCELGRPDLQPTLFTIPRLLNDEVWRQTVLQMLPSGLSDFWRTTFPRYEGSAVPVVTQTIEQLGTSDSLRAFLGQPRSSYNVCRAMDENKIVLLRCSGTGASDQAITSLLLFDLFLAGQSREGIAPEQLQTMFAFCDELRAIDGAASGSIAAILEQLRKYEVRLMAMTQMAMRLSQDTRMALMQNQSLLSATAADSDESAFVTKRMPPLSPDLLEHQPKYHYVMSTMLRGQRTKPFRVAGLQVEKVLADYHHPERLPELHQAMDRNQDRQRVKDVLDRLDGSDDGRRPRLDDLLLNHLTQHPSPSHRPVSPETKSGSEVA